MTMPVIVQTGQGGIETVVKAMRAGAFDFVVKPVSPERLAVSIDNALKVDQRESRARVNQRAAPANTGFRDIISASPAMERVLNLARRAAASNIPVVLEGESGVGKEMIARAIQSGSDRRTKPFVTVNCGAIPDNLVESILFGHEKGAFTGATEKHTGKFVEANGGTLFLDEIGELPLDVQVKLLRAVQHGEIETVGARQATRVDCRLISATNKDLIQEVKDGRFREDLYYRLNVFPIVVPALRRRKEDIPLLVRFFVERFAIEQGMPGPLTIAPETMALLTAYDWPGNIRQLENAVFRAVVLSDGQELTPDVFPQIAAQLPGYEVREAGAGPRVEVTFSAEASDRAGRARAEGGRARRRIARRRPPRRARRTPVADGGPDLDRDAGRGRPGRRQHLQHQRGGRDPAARLGRGGTHPLRAEVLQRPDEPGRPQARHRPVDALSQAQGLRHRSRRPLEACRVSTAVNAGTHFVTAKAAKPPISPYSL